MIQQMIKYTFVLYRGAVAEFMSRLQDLGVVDITAGELELSEQQQHAVGQMERYRGVHAQMGEFHWRGEGGNGREVIAPFAGTEQAVEAFEQAREARAEAVALRTQAGAELEALRPWGEFDAGLMRRLTTGDDTDGDGGVMLRFFEIPIKQFRQEWNRRYMMREISRGRGKVYFVVAFHRGGEDHEGDGGNGWDMAELGARELAAPRGSYRQKLRQIEEYTQEIERQEAVLYRAALSCEAVRADYLEQLDRLHFEQAVQVGEVCVGGCFQVVQGWSVASERARVEQLAQEQAAYYESQVARAEHNPPIQLKNRFFPSLFELIGSLYMKPRYDELDLTPYFAPFYMVFFGMCFGDAGYGALFLLLTVLFWGKIPKTYRPIGWLMIFLSLSTVGWGLVTGNVFGIELAKVEALGSFRDYFVASENMFYVALGLGAVQILAGQTVKIFNKVKKGGGLVHGLGQLGWVVLLYTGVAVSAIRFWGLVQVPVSVLGPVLYGLLGVAVVLIFFLNSPGKNPLVNFGVGLYDCYSMVTGLLGDLMSYIRLFALALSGSIIAQVFNALADGLGLALPVPGLNWLLFVLILLIGHGLTIFVSVLGAFVHPVRLTFVEFYKNAGFEGGGREFAPLKRMK